MKHTLIVSAVSGIWLVILAICVNCLPVSGHVALAMAFVGIVLWLGSAIALVKESY